MSSFNHSFHTFIYCLPQKPNKKFIQKLNFNITERLFKLKFCTIGTFFLREFYSSIACKQTFLKIKYKAQKNNVRRSM